MQRPLSIDPHVFLEVIIMTGCELGRGSSELKSVRNPRKPGLNTIVRLREAMRTRTIEAHLRNLGIPEAEFLRCFDRYSGRSS